MTHRGAVGSDARDGDGAGVMTSLPHKFFIKNFERESGWKLPPYGQYAAGNLFFKPDEETLKGSVDQFESIAEEDRKSTRLNSSHSGESRMPSSA